jgi:hypothetical protein
MLETDGANLFELSINPLRIFSQAPKKQEDFSGLCDGQTAAYFFRLLSHLPAEGGNQVALFANGGEGTTSAFSCFGRGAPEGRLQSFSRRFCCKRNSEISHV